MIQAVPERAPLFYSQKKVNYTLSILAPEHLMSDSHSVIIGLCNPKRPTNVGAVLRAAGCYQAGEVRYNGERFARAAKFSTDTKNRRRDIPLTQADDLLQDIPPDTQVVCIEFAEGAQPLPGFTHPDRAIYIFGPEDGSIPQQLVDRANHVVYIPTIGCMNLAATVNVVLYDRLAKANLPIDHAERIATSRDINNRLVAQNKKTPTPPMEIDNAPEL